MLVYKFDDQDATSFAKAATRDAFKGKIPHRSADSFTDLRPEQLEEIRAAKKRPAPRRDPFDLHLEALSVRLAAMSGVAK